MDGSIQARRGKHRAQRSHGIGRRATALVAAAGAFFPVPAAQPAAIAQASSGPAPVVRTVDHYQPEIGAIAIPKAPDKDHPTKAPVIGQYWEVQPNDFLSQAGALYPGDPIQNAGAIAWINGHRQPNLISPGQRLYLPLQYELDGVQATRNFYFGTGVHSALEVIPVAISQRSPGAVRAEHNSVAAEDLKHRAKTDSLESWPRVKRSIEDAIQVGGLTPEQGLLLLDALKRTDVAALSTQDKSVDQTIEGLLVSLEVVPELRGPKAVKQGLDLNLANALARMILDQRSADFYEAASAHPRWRLEPEMLDAKPNDWLKASEPRRGSTLSRSLLRNAAKAADVRRPRTTAAQLESDLRTPELGSQVDRATRMKIVRALVETVTSGNFQPRFVRDRLPYRQALPSSAVAQLQKAHVRAAAANLVLGLMGTA